MSINVLLHVNALHTTEKARASFYQLLKENLWIKMHPVYLSWCCKYSEEVEDVQDEVISEIRTLAAQAGVAAFHAVAQCGNSEPFWFEYDEAMRHETRSP
jgi:hypothetical protein